VGNLRREPVSADQRVRPTPGFAVELAEGLSEPAREGEVIELAENLAVFGPELVKW